MSTTLYFQPVPKVEPPKEDIDELKYILHKRYSNDFTVDASIAQDLAVLNQDDLPFLEGVTAGNGNGDYARAALKLIQAIREHGRVKIFLQE